MRVAAVHGEEGVGERAAAAVEGVAVSVLAVRELDLDVHGPGAPLLEGEVRHPSPHLYQAQGCNNVVSSPVCQNQSSRSADKMAFKHFIQKRKLSWNHFQISRKLSWNHFQIYPSDILLSHSSHLERPLDLCVHLGAGQLAGAGVGGDPVGQGPHLPPRPLQRVPPPVQHGLQLQLIQ